MLISTITSNIPFIQLSLMHRITKKICKERWQHWCTKISGVKVLPTLLISTITSNMSFIQLSLMLSGYPASSFLVAFNKKRVVIGDWKEGLSAELDAETAIQVILSKDVVDPCGPAASSLARAVLCLLVEGTVYDVNWICLNVGQRRHDITVSLAGRIDIKKRGMGR